jgi:RNA polymerase primary sigma factor
MSSKSDGALNSYLRKVGQVPLLTPNEEIELGRRIQDGDAVARERMIHANLRLVVTIARDYVNLGLPLLDLISEGNIGLMEAVGRFDPGKGSKFSTYASWWIKWAIKRALVNQSKTVRLPAQVVDRIARMRRVSAQVSNDLGREPTDEELAEELGIPNEKITRLKRAGLRPASLDAPIYDEEQTALCENIPDDQSLTPFEFLREKDFSEQIDRLLKTLNERETTIIAHRFGLNGMPVKPLEQVGELIGVTHERVRRLELAALAKLRRAFNKHLGPVESEVFAAA